MSVVAMLKAPLISADRPVAGVVLGTATGAINGVPLLVTLTAVEVHIAWADRDGPVFVVRINQLIKAAVDEIEILLGQGKA